MTALIWSSGARAETVLRVKQGATGAANGSSWADAYPFLADALTAAEAAFGAGGGPVEVWVAKGLYHPDESAASPLGSGSRSSSFVVPRETSLYGGFVGDELLKEDRPALVHPSSYPPVDWTVLSGDLNDDDDLSTFTSPFYPTFAGYGNRSDNSLRVVSHVPFAEREDSPVEFDGFFIFGGHDEGSDANGTGMRTRAWNSIISDCVFYANATTGPASFEGGAALRIENNRNDVLVRNCSFIGNVAEFGRGGAVLLSSNRSINANEFAGADFVNCRFVGNRARFTGAILGYTLPNGSGSGVVRVRALNCTMASNVTVDASYGEAVSAIDEGNDGALEYDVENSFFFGNAAGPGGAAPAIYSTTTAGDEIRVRRSAVQEGVNGSIFVNNNVLYDQFTLDLFENVLQTAHFEDDYFIDDGSGLRGWGPDRLWGTIDDNYRVEFAEAPIVDLGDNAIYQQHAPDLHRDIDHADRFIDGDHDLAGETTIDIGCYEFQEGCPTCPGGRLWKAAANGLFYDAMNWTVGPPGALNVARFEAGGPPYRVDFNGADAMSDRVIVTMDTAVGFDLRGGDYDVLHAGAAGAILVGGGIGQLPSLEISNNGLLSGGTLSGLIAVIGDEAPSHGKIAVQDRAELLVLDSLIIGNLGRGELCVSDGGIVTAFGADVGNLPGSYGSVSVSGLGSVFSVPFGLFIRNGVVEVSDGGTLISDFVGTFVFQNGLLTGDGTVLGEVTSIGGVIPNAASGPATLTIDGDYRQVGHIPVFGEQSGSLALDVFSAPGGHDTLTVTGAAELGGAVVVNFAPGADPQTGDEFEVLSAGALSGRFDVAYFNGFYTGLSDNRFMRLAYAPSARGLGGDALTVFVDTLIGSPNLENPMPGGATNGTPTAAAIVDLNQDGFDDLLVTVPGGTPGQPGELIVFLNTGTFTLGVWDGFTQASYPVGVHPSGVAAGAFNDDPHIDVVVVNRDDDDALILMNNGSGVLSVLGSIEFSAVSLEDPTGVAVADFDRDGFADVAVIGENALTPTGFSGLAAVAINDTVGGGGFGGFSPALTHSVGVGPSFIASGDLDNDKDLDDDVAIANRRSGTVTVLFNQGNDGGGAWQGLGGRTDIAVGDDPVWIALGDLDLDGPSPPQMPENDLLVANFGSGSAAIVLNNGDGSFAASSPIPIGQQPRSVALADLDGDGDLDAAVVVLEGAQNVIRVLRNDLVSDGIEPQLAFAQTEDLLGAASPLLILAGDLDNQNTDDLVSVSASAGALLLTRGQTAMEEVQIRLTGLSSFCLGDLNGDRIVNTADLGLLIAGFGGSEASADLNGDGVVNTADLGLMLGAFGPCEASSRRIGRPNMDPGSGPEGADPHRAALVGVDG